MHLRLTVFHYFCAVPKPSLPAAQNLSVWLQYKPTLPFGVHTAPRAWAYVGAQLHARCSWVSATPSKGQCCGHTRGCSHTPPWFLPTAKVRVALAPHKGWEDCLLAQANLPHKLFGPQLFLKAWLCGWECYGGLHLHALFIWF